MADFSRRGFRTDRPDARAILEGHARSFLTGFNLAVAHWRDPHPALATIAEEERGFAYEGAAMFARLIDITTLGRSRALARLLAGHGQCYVHLIHVGAGWPFGLLRLRLPVAVPATPLVRWLALDGAGFAEAFFGGWQVVVRRCVAGPDERAEARYGGYGRALWFIEAGDVDGIARRVAALPTRARAPVWSGVGLACAYAGATDDVGRRRLSQASGDYRQHFAQGLVFAAGARARAAIIPTHTERACRQLLQVDATEAASLSDVTARGLTSRGDIAAYLNWRTRIRESLSTIVTHD
ncbi:DUF1702 family protein [Haloechinothrix salitolerans]|uniref:DUF1702 family protein n=1 Tax=Haloechinothrix salitolerans TaxID=926830 RepID=A0ABW2BW72_9PSEU